jgi:hypothetical protein
MAADCQWLEPRWCGTEDAIWPIAYRRIRGERPVILCPANVFFFLLRWRGPVNFTVGGFRRIQKLPPPHDAKLGKAALRSSL